jgi:hypothetical protein
VSEIPDLGRGAVRAGLARLVAEGVAVTLGEHVLASRCARRFDDLNLIGL